MTVTQVVPSTAILTPTPISSPQPSVSCTSKCQVDFTASRLEYPGDVVVSTAYVPTVSLDVYTDSAGRTVRTSLYTVPVPTPATTSTITWQFSNVALTWPTVYAAYVTFSHFSVTPLAAACATSTYSLTLSSPTNFSPLIVPTSLIPDPNIVATQVVDYLNTQPTVIAQLGRPIGAGACDPLLSTAQSSSTKSLGTQSIVTTVAQVGATGTRTLAEAANLPSQAPVPDPPSVTPSPPPPAPTPPASSSNAPVPTPSAAPQPSSSAPVASSAPPSPPPESSRADSASQVPPPPSPSPPPPPSPITSRGTTTSRNGTVSAPLPSSISEFTGAAALPTGQLVGWLVGAAGLGLGLM